MTIQIKVHQNKHDCLIPINSLELNQKSFWFICCGSREKLSPTKMPLQVKGSWSYMSYVGLYRWTQWVNTSYRLSNFNRKSLKKIIQIKFKTEQNNVKQIKVAASCCINFFFSWHTDFYLSDLCQHPRVHQLHSALDLSQSCLGRISHYADPTELWRRRKATTGRAQKQQQLSLKCSIVFLLGVFSAAANSVWPGL